MSKKITTARVLTYLGILPFLLGALIFFDSALFGFKFSEHWVITYGAIIASFIAGIHWGLYLAGKAPINLFIHSNIVALAAWSALLISPVYSFILLTLCFLYLIVIDIRLARAGVIQPWFLRLRKHATIAVISVCLGFFS